MPSFPSICHLIFLTCPYVILINRYTPRTASSERPSNNLFVYRSVSTVTPMVSTYVSFLWQCLSWGAFLAPLALSFRAISTYTGFNVQSRNRVILERFVFIVVTQSLPLYLIVSLSLKGLVYWVLALTALCLILSQFIALVRRVQKRIVVAARGHSPNVAQEPTSIGIYHPHCHQRAGGEMVLWSLIKVVRARLSTLSSSSTPRILIYSNILPQASIALPNNATQNWEQEKDEHHGTRDSIPPPDKLPASISSISSTLRGSLGKYIISQAASTFAIDLSGMDGKTTPAANSTTCTDLRGKPAGKQTEKMPASVSGGSTSVSVNSSSAPISFCFLRHTDMSDPQHYPRLTLVLQSFNAVLPMLEAALIGIVQEKEDEPAKIPESSRIGKMDEKKTSMSWDEALVRRSLSLCGVSLNTAFVLPTLVVDTAGYPFTAAMCRVLGLRYGCYVHYPIISSDMLAAVSSGASQFNNNTAIAKSRLLTQVKLVYYRVFARIYQWIGSLNAFSVANGSWTQDHLYSVWNIPRDFSESEKNGKSGNLSSKIKIPIVYPPCKLGSLNLYENSLSVLAMKEVQPCPLAKTTSSAHLETTDNHTTTTGAAGRASTSVSAFSLSSTPSPKLVHTSVYPRAIAAITAAITAEHLDSNQVVAEGLNGDLDTVYGSGKGNAAYASAPYIDARRLPIIMSLGQFRPEKNHSLQIRAFSRALASLGRKTAANGIPYRLVLVGTSRPADMPRVAALRELIKSLDLTENVTIHLDFPRTALNALLARATVGLHSMRDEHFGIGVVELLDAGLITIGHNSAGPKMDIIVPAVNIDAIDAEAKPHGRSGSFSSSSEPTSTPTQAGSCLCAMSAQISSLRSTGYLAATEEEYARAIVDILRKYDVEQLMWQEWAKTQETGEQGDTNHAVTSDIASSSLEAPVLASLPISDLAIIRYNARAHVRRLFSEECFAKSVERTILDNIKQFM